MKKSVPREKSSLEYDPFRTPASYQKALQHKKAHLVGLPPKKTEQRSCECCMQPINKKLFDFRCSHRALGFLGTSLAFYFDALKITLILLVALLLTTAPLTFPFNSDVSYSLFSADLILALPLSHSHLPYPILIAWTFCVLGVLLAKKYSDR
jgi:hypothetical protein